MKPHPPPVAVFRPSRWPGLVWAVPVAAVLLVGWLAANAWLRRGPTVTVTLPIAGGIKAGSTKVQYNGFEVGEVHTVSLSKDLGHLLVELDFDSSMEGHLGPSTQYWIGGDTFDLDNLASVKSLLSGPYIGVAPRTGRTVTKVVGLVSPPNPHPPPPDAVAYSADFPGGAAGLKTGDPVQLEGTEVGSVTRVEMRYSRAERAIRTNVVFVLEPEEIGLKDEAWSPTQPRPQMDAMVGALIERGLRAEIGASIPVVGGKEVKLSLAKDEPPARLTPGDPPAIPTIGSGGGIAEMIHQAGEVVATARQAAEHVEDMTRQADAQIPPMLRHLDATIAATQQSMERVRTLLSTEGLKNAGVENTDLPHALYEMSRAAESLRELTDFLNSHPNALIFGRQH